jgi:hypothetical protein
MPVAGVREDYLKSVGHACPLKLGLGGVDHFFQVPEIGGVDVHLGGDHNLLLGRDRLRVIALHVSARRLHVLRVRVRDVDLSRRYVWWLVGIRRATEAPPVLHHPARTVGLISLVRGALDSEFLLQSAF